MSEKFYCQRDLNKIFEQPDFDLEFNMLNVIKIFAFVSLHTFLVPYSLILSLFFLIFVYMHCKWNLFNHYTIQNFKGIIALKKYLNNFGYYF